MNRRSLLGSLALLAGSGLAGCTGDLAGTADENSPTNPTETTRPTPDACPTTMGYDVERPDDLTEESVEEFVVAYEKIYVIDADSNVSQENASASVDVQSLERHGKGYTVEVLTAYGVDEPPDTTPKTYYTGSFGTNVLYYVDSLVVRRTEGPYSDPDPRDGVLLECEER